MSRPTRPSVHEHCWHHTNQTLTTDPPRRVEQCCWCGYVRHTAVTPPARLNRHGIFATTLGPPVRSGAPREGE